MLVSTPAFELNPLSRALKFYGFDDLCVSAARAAVADEWAPEPTSPGGWHVVDPALLGATPTTEI